MRAEWGTGVFSVQNRQDWAMCRYKGTMCLNVQESDEGVIGSSQGDTENSFTPGEKNF